MQTFTWQEYPLARPLAALIAGFLFYQYQYEIVLPILIGLLLVLFLPGLLRICKVPMPTHYPLKSIGLLAILILLGYVKALWNDNPVFTSRHVTHLSLEEDHNLLIKIVEGPSKNNPRSYKGSILYQYHADKTVEVSGLIKLIFARKDTVPGYLPNDIILLNCGLSTIKRNTNPHTFDYPAYLRKKGIDRQGFVTAGKHTCIHKIKANALKSAANLCRSKAIDILDTKVRNEDAKGVMQAMLLGYKDELNPEIEASYVQAGVVHILAVSGLHVGILTSLLFLFLNLIPSPGTSGKIIKTTVVILFVAFYALVSGGAPSVIRASIMCTIVLLSHYLQEDSNLFNSLFLAAFTMLTFNPNYLYQLGFQFSFLALFSIVFFQNKLLHLWRPRYKLLEGIYQLFLLSFSAQILLFPLSIYYFKQVPTLFMFSGILAIPMAYIILYFGIGILLSESLGLAGIASILAKIISELIHCFHFYTTWVSGLSISVIEDFFIGKDMLLLSYSILISFMLFVSIKRKAFAYAALLLSFLMIALTATKGFEKLRQNYIYIYDLNKKHAIDFTFGKKTYALIDSTLSKKQVQYNIIPNRQANATRSSVVVLDPEDHQDPFLKWNNNFLFWGKKNAFITPKWFERPDPTCLNIDYLIVSRGSRVPPEMILNYLSPKMILLDKSIPLPNHHTWKAIAKSRKIPFLSVWENGAITIKC